jgi:hypothetical protein
MIDLVLYESSLHKTSPGRLWICRSAADGGRLDRNFVAGVGVGASDGGYNSS